MNPPYPNTPNSPQNNSYPNSFGNPPLSSPQQPQFGAQQPQFGAQQPQFGAQQPQFGAQQPQFGAQQPQFGMQQPQFGAQNSMPAAPSNTNEAKPGFFNRWIGAYDLQNGRATKGVIHAMLAGFVFLFLFRFLDQLLGLSFLGELGDVFRSSFKVLSYLMRDLIYAIILGAVNCIWTASNKE